MRSTFSLLPYINRSKVRADGTTAVLCRITIDGKQTAISTGIYCRPEDWNGKNNEIKTIRENNRLREYLRLTEEAYAEILKSQRRGQCRDVEKPHFLEQHPSDHLIANG